MDPDTTLAEIRELSAWLCTTFEGDIDYSRAVGLAERIADLDTWLSKGGFLPLAWQNFGNLKKED